MGPDVAISYAGPAEQIRIVMSEGRWVHFPHQADMGVRGVGPTLADAFELTALAMTAVVTDPARVAPKEAVDIHCEALDDELLLVDWMNA